MNDISGTTALVTGPGRAVATAWARAGAQLVGVGRDRDRLRADLGGPAWPWPAWPRTRALTAAPTC